MHVRLLSRLIILMAFTLAMALPLSAHRTAYYQSRYPARHTTRAVYTRDRSHAREVYHAPGRLIHYVKRRVRRDHLTKKKVAIEAAKIASPSLVKMAIFGA